MKTLPKLPYIQNIVSEWHRHNGGKTFFTGQQMGDEYREFLKTFGFKVPVTGDYLEFPDDFPDEKITLFVLRWS